MSGDGDRAGLRRLEGLLAGVLHYGTWLASTVIALGLAAALIESWAGAPSWVAWPATHLVTAGIAMFILLPVLRVTLMLVVFLRDRDYCFSAIAALVLLIIFLGFVLGLRMASAGRAAVSAAQDRPNVAGVDAVGPRLLSVTVK